jgi:predicted nucleic acid-binding protein
VIVLDTNVVSALMLRTPDRSVVRWLDRQPAESVWTTSITVFEVWFGLELLAKGRRRTALEAAFLSVLREDFEGRVLDFDEEAARCAATMAAAGKRDDHPTEIRDIEIAGIVLARRAVLATRNAKHFDRLGIALVDPWGG